MTRARAPIGDDGAVPKRHTRLIAAAGLSLAFLPLLSACSSTPADPIAAARTLADAPGWVSAPTGTDCGDVDLTADRSLPDKALKCLSDARGAGHEARLAWIERTTEGDPVPYFAKTEESGLTVVSTSAYDSFGQGGWSENECAGIAALGTCLADAE